MATAYAVRTGTQKGIEAVVFVSISLLILALMAVVYTQSFLHVDEQLGTCSEPLGVCLFETEQGCPNAAQLSYTCQEGQVCCSYVRLPALQTHEVVLR